MNCPAEQLIPLERTMDFNLSGILHASEECSDLVKVRQVQNRLFVPSPQIEAEANWPCSSFFPSRDGEVQWRTQQFPFKPALLVASYDCSRNVVKP